MKLKDCLETIIDNRGKNPKYYVKEAYPVIDNVMIKNNYHPNLKEATRFIDQETHDIFLRGYLEPDLPIMTLVGSGIGNVSLSIDDKSVIVQNTIGFKTKPEILNSIYLYYWFLYKHEELIQFNRGSGQPSIRKTDIENMNIDFKNINYQKKVSKILSNIDKKIELNNEINNNLYELGKALYKKYFKDLPADNTKKLGELCNIKYGKGLPTKKIEKEGYPVYGGNGIIGYYHEFMYDDSQVLISCRGAASGNVIVSKPKSFVTNNSLILESDRKYHHYLKQYSLDNYYYEYTTGSAQPQITIDNIKDIVLIIPSDELLEAFNKQMDSLELKAFANLEELEKLKKLRDTLLPKLMNGEIDLDNIEI